MCYFSDGEKRRQMKGVMTAQQMDAMKHVLLPYALKLQIGCGAEPTLYNDLVGMVEMGKAAGVPYISLTTNGQLLANGKIDFELLVASGLDEITLSLHGTTQDIYENLMPGANYDNLIKLIDKLAVLKKLYGKPAIRVNFTVNSLNIDNLRENSFFKIWDDANCTPDIIQLRPVQKVGDTEWDDFDMLPIKQNYADTIENVANISKSRGIMCMYPTLDALDGIAEEQDGTSALIEDVTYCYVGPDSFYKADFDLDKNSFRSYHKHKKTARKVLKAAIFGSKSRQKNVSKKLNYTVK